MPVAAIAIRASRRLLDALIIGLVGVVLATLAIARVIPLLTGGATFVVGGGSMAPAIPLGSVVLTSPVAATDLRAGDVVSLRAGAMQAVFTHRITRVVSRDDGVWVETRGDANPEPDPSLVPVGSIIGRVSLAIPFAGYVVMLLSTVAGEALLLSLASFLVAGAWLLATLDDGRRAAPVCRAAGAGRAPTGPEPATGQGA